MIAVLLRELVVGQALQIPEADLVCRDQEADEVEVLVEGELEPDGDLLEL